MISDKTLQEELIQLSDELEKQTIQLRREIHQCPELSFHEYKTSRVVMRELERIGINPKGWIINALKGKIKDK